MCVQATLRYRQNVPTLHFRQEKWIGYLRQLLYTYDLICLSLTMQRVNDRRLALGFWQQDDKALTCTHGVLFHPNVTMAYWTATGALLWRLVRDNLHRVTTKHGFQLNALMTTRHRALMMQGNQFTLLYRHLLRWCLFRHGMTAKENAAMQFSPDCCVTNSIMVYAFSTVGAISRYIHVVANGSEKSDSLHRCNCTDEFAFVNIRPADDDRHHRRASSDLFQTINAGRSGVVRRNCYAPGEYMTIDSIAPAGMASAYFSASLNNEMRRQNDYPCCHWQCHCVRVWCGLILIICSQWCALIAGNLSLQGYSVYKPFR